MNLAQLTQQVISLSTAIANYIAEQAKKQVTVDLKTLNNLVTVVDKTAEQMFVDGLSKLLPEAGFIAEEGTSVKKGETYNWVIDPLDGTTNFVHGIPAYCTSVALLKDNQPIIGVVYAVQQQECFSAYLGGGAMLNETPIHCSDNALLKNALLATGFPYDDFTREQAYLKAFQYFFRNTRGLRRLGSAALDLAYVACGRVDGFFEYGLNPWDVAGGALIVKEAGGIVTDFKQGTDYIFGEEIVASSTPIQPPFFKVLTESFN